MKSFTDIEQSKKLAEILPIESADMFYVYDRHKDKFYGDTPYVGYRVLNIDVDMPCWSLAALLNVIPFCSLRRFVDGNWIVAAEFSFKGYRVSLPNKSAVDACVEIIITLHEQKGGDK